MLIIITNFSITKLIKILNLKVNVVVLLFNKLNYHYNLNIKITLILLLPFLIKPIYYLHIFFIKTG